MERILEQFRAISHEPLRRLEDWKRSHNCKIIGCQPMYIPEEIIDAAGILPIVPMGDDAPVSANQYIQTNTCDTVRINLETALSGKFDYLDGLVFSDICDPMQFLAGIWKIAHPMPYLYVLDIPHKLDASGGEYLLKTYRKFRTSLEELSSKRITEQALKDSIRTYNRSRQLLRELYSLRREGPGLVSARHMANIVCSGLLMPKKEYNILLDKLLVKARSQKPGKTGTKLMLGGYLCRRVPEIVLDLIEELGGVIVDDEIYVGARYFAGEVRESGDPLDALVEYYINRIPCTTMHYPERYSQVTATVIRPGYTQFLIDGFKKSGARGLLVLMVPFCDPYDFKYPDISDKLTKSGIPFLKLEVGYDTGSAGTIRTRLQAFMEILQQDG